MLAGLEAGEIRIRPERPPAAFTAGTAMMAVAPLLQMHWSLVSAPAGAEYIISDAPVALHSEQSAESSVATGIHPGIGFATPDVEVMLPLASRHALLATYEAILPGQLIGSPEMVQSVNVHVWANAQEYVFGSSDSILRAVEQYVRGLGIDPGHRAGWTVD
jgi:Protein of unknown function (DUF4238)